MNSLILQGLRGECQALADDSIRANHSFIIWAEAFKKPHHRYTVTIGDFFHAFDFDKGNTLYLRAAIIANEEVERGGTAPLVMHL